MPGMSVKMKDPKTGEEYSFAPARDIAYFYLQLVAVAGQGLLQENWEPWYEDLLYGAGVSEEELTRTVAAFTKFCGWAVHPDHIDMEQALTDAGFFKCPKAAQLVFLAKLGQICAGAFWDGIRSATPMGVTPNSVAQLAQTGAQLSKYISEKWGSDDESAERASQPVS